MTHRKSDRSIWNQVLGQEERSRLRAARARSATREPELASLSSGINQRRRSRTDVTQVFPRAAALEPATPERVASSALPRVQTASAVSTSTSSDQAQSATSAAPSVLNRAHGAAVVAFDQAQGAAGAAPSVLNRAHGAAGVAVDRAQSAAGAAPSSLNHVPTTASRGAPNRSPGSAGVVATGGAPSASAPRGGAPGTVLGVTRIGGSVAMLQIAKPAGLRFRAGQHVKISIPGGGKNPYSIASAPSDPHLDLCVERIPGGRVSTQLYALEPGSRLELESQPKGSFVLQPNAAVHLMLATVTGIAPFRSILREAAAQNQWPHIVVLHGASFADELPYRQELEALAQRFPQHLRYLPSVSRPTDLRNRNFQGLTGRLTDLAPSLLRELQASRPGQSIQVYACGHPDMVSTATSTLSSMGFKVISEVFD